MTIWEETGRAGVVAILHSSFFTLHSSLILIALTRNLRYDCLELWRALAAALSWKEGISMTRVQMTQAVAADYADAMLVARRAKNVLFFFLILVLLIQLGVFVVVRYV